MQVNYALGDSGRSWVIGEQPVCYMMHGIIVPKQELLMRSFVQHCIAN